MYPGYTRRKEAAELAQQYILGWKQNSLQLITTCLAENCIIIESHGPTYYGIRGIEQWFKLWLAAKGTVQKWDITSFSFCENEQTAFCEWDFACVANNTEYVLSGASVIRFINNKISFIHEYRMVHSVYDWNGDELKSE